MSNVVSVRLATHVYTTWPLAFEPVYNLLSPPH
jgi:hypothetical protein